VTTQPTPEVQPDLTTLPLKVDPKAVQAAVVRYAVPTLVGVLVALAAKAGFALSPSDALGIVAPVVATAYSVVAHVLEAKFPALKRVLGSPRPTSYIK